MAGSRVLDASGGGRSTDARYDKIHITPLDLMGQSDDGTPIVRFRCAIGIGAGKWSVSAWQYSIQTYAELDITPTLKLGHNTVVNPQVTAHRMECSSTETVIVGTVEAIDDDGMAYIRLSEDGLIMIESVLGELASGMQVTIRVPHDQLVVVG